MAILCWTIIIFPLKSLASGIFFDHNKTSKSLIFELQNKKKQSEMSIKVETGKVDP